MPAEDDVVDADERAIAVLGASVERLGRLVGELTPDQLRQSAYPTEWTIADVLSHVGSGALIMWRRLEDTLAGQPFDNGFMSATWDSWNAKAPDEQAADAVIADRALHGAIAAVEAGDRSSFTLPFGPLTLDFGGFVRLRINEHALHSWDVAVALDPSARLPADVTGLVVDTVGVIAGFTGKPAAEAHTLRVRTTDPARDLTLELGTEAVTLAQAADGAGGGEPDLELPAEAFIRLVYGRLDPDHTPAGVATTHLDELRRTFPGL